MAKFYTIRQETAQDAPAIQTLMRLSFPPSHAQRGIWGLRGGEAVAELCLVAESPPEFHTKKTLTDLPSVSASESAAGLLGSIRYWPIRLAGKAGLVLGPLAVDPRVRGCGIGVALVRQSLARAEWMSREAMLGAGESGEADVADVAKASAWEWCLVSADPVYYLKFGFRLAGALRLPQPIEAVRLHVLALPGAAGGRDMPKAAWEVVAG